MRDEFPWNPLRWAICFGWASLEWRSIAILAELGLLSTGTIR